MLEPDISENSFGYHKHLTAEQLLYYGRGDLCDLSGFLYTLLRQIPEIETILIKTKTGLDECVLGVYVPEQNKSGFEYKGKTYIVCDFSLSRLGDTQINLEKDQIEIVELN